MKSFTQSTIQTPEHVVAVLLPVVAAFSAIYVLTLRPIYFLLFHPLRKYPGPKLWAASYLPLLYSQTTGLHHQRLLALHCQFGEVVRISPTELSYVQPGAWKEIMGRPERGQQENAKDPVFYKDHAKNIVGADREHHRQNRRIISPGFSAKAMLDQQGLFGKHIDLFFQKMREKADLGQPVNIVEWYNFVTFDIIGDLAFGESFHCLEQSRTHPWMAVIFDNIKQGSLMGNLRRFLFYIDEVFGLIIPSATRAMRKHREFVADQVARRCALSSSRPDLMACMLPDAKGPKLTDETIRENCSALVIAGSETTATVLSFATYLLCTHPEVFASVQAEVDNAFTSENEIDIKTVSQLPIMLAVLKEAMRLYPAAPSTLPRITPHTGQNICGRFVPGNTTIGIPQWVAYHYPKNFQEPEMFEPKRWLDETAFPRDRKDVFNPFSHGPRDCIGKHLAYAEMRIILARTLYIFEMKLDKRSKTWAESMRIYLLWQKPAMYIHLQSRKRQSS